MKIATYRTYQGALVALFPHLSTKHSSQTKAEAGAQRSYRRFLKLSITESNITGLLSPFRRWRIRDKIILGFGRDYVHKNGQFGDLTSECGTR